MGARGIANNLYKNGLFSGYADYRYGVASARPVTLATSAAPRKAKPIFKERQRKPLVEKVIDEMQVWKRTPFENEGPMIAALRAQLCLDGHGWHEADQEARHLVATALKLMRAKRPTWEQGQREYTERRDHCTHCGKPIDDLSGSAKAYHFCSVVCARAVMNKRDFEQRSESDRLYAAAARVLKKARTKPRSCQWCGEQFSPVRDASTQQYCSFSCASKGRHAKPKPVLDMTCHYCETTYQTTDKRSMYCSKRCRNMVSKIRHLDKPAHINPQVFDYVFREAA